MNKKTTTRRKMKFGTCLLVFMTWVAWAPLAGAADPDQSFASANQAYDQGDFTSALDQYRKLIDLGYANVETFYNAANAAFRNGSPGLAVLYYRRAWYLSPRDADVLANLELAQERTGALKPSVSIWEQAARELSHHEWTRVMRSSYWFALLATALALFVPVTRRVAKPLAVVSAVAALVGFGGWFYWKTWSNRGEAVIIAAKQTALYEPREKATPFFAVPEGSIVYIEDSFHSWVKIEAGQNAGWLPKNAIELVYPWQATRLD